MDYLLLSSAGDTKFIYPTLPNIRQNKRKTTLMYDGLNPRLLYCGIICLFCQISVIGLKVWLISRYIRFTKMFFEIPGRDFLGILYGEVSWTFICNIVNASIFFIEMVCVINGTIATLKFSTISKHIRRIINAVISEIS